MTSKYSALSLGITCKDKEHALRVAEKIRPSLNKDRFEKVYVSRPNRLTVVIEGGVEEMRSKIAALNIPEVTLGDIQVLEDDVNPEHQPDQQDADFLNALEHSAKLRKVCRQLFTDLEESD
jgi:hypothetical protein